MCLICDNAKVNQKPASISRKPSVGCKSHKLNLEVNRIIKEDNLLFKVIESVHATMKSARKLKNAAILRNITDYCPVLNYETRWSGKRRMLDRFIKIRNKLIEASMSMDADLIIGKPPDFEMDTQKFARMLAEIDAVTKSLQTRAHTLALCREDVGKLNSSIAKQKDLPYSPLHSYKLGNHYIELESSIVTHRVFESALIKIQEGREKDLITQEKRSVTILLKIKEV